MGTLQSEKVIGPAFADAAMRVDAFVLRLK
jgi:hypothetical protein